MALRLVQFIVPTERKEDAFRILRENETTEYWSVEIGNGKTMVSILLPSEGTEGLMDTFEDEFSNIEGYRAMVMEVLAYSPHPGKDNGKNGQDSEKKEQEDSGRIGRDELYSILVDQAKISKTYVALMLLSVIVAAIGVFEDNVAIIIGGAIINPLLGPNMSLSLATNLADGKLAARSLLALGVGIGLIIGVSFILGSVLDINPFIEEITSRRDVQMGEIVLAIASGSAAALLLTLRASTSLVGVAAAVALLPPLVVLGLLAGNGDFDLLRGPLLLFVTDLICINLAGVFTFYAMGIRPSRWWETDRAQRLTIVAILVWGSLLVVLAVLIYISQSP